MVFPERGTITPRDRPATPPQIVTFHQKFRGIAHRLAGYRVGTRSPPPQIASRWVGGGAVARRGRVGMINSYGVLEDSSLKLVKTFPECP